MKDFAEQGAKALLQQAGRGSKRRQGQRSNLSTTKWLKLCSHITVPRHTKWITDDGSRIMVTQSNMTNMNRTYDSEEHRFRAT